ncbi:MAG TPA: PIN domain-containing protein [Thermoanaerobaculia bacterium]|nr:PIN domain-containing protein [Thermoanaerobaculia bacterium]
MRRILVDTNVALDVVLDREPHSAVSAALLSALEAGRCEGFLAAHAFTTIFYLTAKQRDRATAHQAVKYLLSFLRVASVDDAVLRRAALVEGADFEDSVTSAAAEAARCDVLATRDPAGFRQGLVRAIAPDLLLAALAEEVHEPASEYGGAPKRRRRRPGNRG